MTPIKNPADSGESKTAGFHSDTKRKDSKKAPRVKPGTKEHAILSVLVSGRSLNRFEAIKLHDTALNSTVATLQTKGIHVHRKRETVPCVDGDKTVDVMRYSLLPDQIEKARALMEEAA